MPKRLNDSDKKGIKMECENYRRICLRYQRKFYMNALSIRKRKLVITRVGSEKVDDHRPHTTDMGIHLESTTP